MKRNRQKTVSRHHKLAVAIGASVMALSMSVIADDVNYELDIAAQRTDAALLELAQKSGVQIIFTPEVAMKNRSPLVKGSYSLNRALTILLANSNLTYQMEGDDVVLVKEKEKPEDSSEAEDKNDVEAEIIVTGSRLVTDPGKLTRQQTTITREELEASGITRLDEYLRRLPQNVNAPSNIAAGIFEEGANFGQGKNVYAGSSVNLRGLGEQYTLILIDGRRPAKGGLFGDVVDISTIPMEQVDRIEILYDGAAALYGADAVGGVINIITDREFDGTRLSLSISETEDGGGEQANLSLGHTFNWETGSATANLSYQTSKGVDGAQRPIQFTPLPVGGSNFALSNDQDLRLFPSVPGNIGTGFTVPQVLFFVNDIDGDGRTDNAALDERLSGGIEEEYTDFFGNTRVRQRVRVPPAGYIPVYTAQLPAPSDSISLYDIAEDTSVPLPASDAPVEEVLSAMRARFPLGESTYNAGEGFSLTPETQEIAASFNIQQEFGDNLIARLSYRYTESERDSSTRNDTHQRAVSWSVPNNPFVSNFFMNFSDNLPQTFQDVNSEGHSLSGGFDYTFNKDWRMQFDFGVSENKSVSDRTNALNSFALGQAVNGRSLNSQFQYEPNGLGYFMPFFGYENEQAYNEALIIDRIHTETTTESRDVNVNVTGVVGELPHGDMRTNIILSRVEDITETYSQQFDDEFSRLIAEDLRRDAKEGRTGLGAEFSAPVLESVLANVNARYEQYDNLEDTAFNWAAGFNWEATDWMTVRLNRTHSVRIAQATLSGSETQIGVGFLLTYDENRQWAPGPVRSTYRIGGGHPSLRPERNYGTALGFIFHPLDGLDIQLNLTESTTNDQIGSPLVNARYTPAELLPEAVAANPLLSISEDGRIVVDGQVFTETSLGDSPNLNGDPIVGGRFVLDARQYNVGNAFTRNADLQIRYAQSTDFGDWFVNYAHQYIHKSEIVASDFCNGDACDLLGDSASGAAIDLVKQIDRDNALVVARSFSPLPEHRGSLDVSWSYRGLSINAQTVLQSETSVLERDTSDGLDNQGQPITLENLYRINTQAPVSINMNLAYDFSGDLFGAPRWLQSTRINLQIGNLFYKETEVTRDVLVQEFEPGAFRATSGFTPFAIDPFGRRFSLTVNTSF